MGSFDDSFWMLVRFELNRLWLSGMRKLWCLFFTSMAFGLCLVSKWLAGWELLVDDRLVGQAVGALTLVSSFFTSDPRSVYQASFGYSLLSIIICSVVACTKLLVPMFAAWFFATEQSRRRLEDIRLTLLTPGRIYLGGVFVVACPFLMLALLVPAFGAFIAHWEDTPAGDILHLWFDGLSQVILAATISTTTALICSSVWTALTASYVSVWGIIPVAWLSVVYLVHKISQVSPTVTLNTGYFAYDTHLEVSLAHIAITLVGIMAACCAGIKALGKQSARPNLGRLPCFVTFGSRLDIVLIVGSLLIAAVLAWVLVTLPGRAKKMQDGWASNQRFNKLCLVRAEYYTLLGQARKACQELNRLRDIPYLRNWDVHQAKADALFAAGDYKEAAWHYARARDDYENRLAYVICHLAQGRHIVPKLEWKRWSCWELYAHALGLPLSMSRGRSRFDFVPSSAPAPNSLRELIDQTRTSVTITSPNYWEEITVDAWFTTKFGKLLLQRIVASSPQRRDLREYLARAMQTLKLPQHER